MFEVKGDRAQWRVLYERIAGMQIGEVVKDSDLFALLPDAPEGSVRSAFRRAVREAEDELSRTFDRVRLVGYKMVDAIEHERIARQHHKRSRRQLRTAERKVHSADRSRLTQEDRQRFDRIEMNLARQREMLSRLEAKVQRETRERKTDTANLSERVDRITKLLERHGITKDEASAV